MRLVLLSLHLSLLALAGVVAMPGIRQQPVNAQEQCDAEIGRDHAPVPVGPVNDASVSGRVVDEAGRPLLDILVSAFAYRSDRECWVMRRTQRSDADGRFHLPLPAGIYIIGTDGRHWPNRLTHEERFTGRLLVYDFHFFAQSGSPRNATRVELRTGAERTDVDLPLALTPAYSVSGSVTGPRAGPALLTLKRLIDGEPLPEWFDLGTDSRDAAGRDTGHFTFPAVPAGEYWLSAVSYKSFSFGGVNLPVSEARLKISVSSDTTDLAVELRTGESAR